MQTLPCPTDAMRGGPKHIAKQHSFFRTCSDTVISCGAAGSEYPDLRRAEQDQRLGSTEGSVT
jgi:hypothetical protein